VETRRHLRIRQLMDVTWSMPGEDLAGQGLIVNISNSGLLLQIDNSFKPLDQCVLAVDPALEDEEKPPFLSKKGKVVWFRRINTSRYTYQCGLEFLREPRMDNDLLSWIEHKTAQLSQTMNVSILNNYAN
jgi:hypothetical protein